MKIKDKSTVGNAKISLVIYLISFLMMKSKAITENALNNAKYGEIINNGYICGIHTVYIKKPDFIAEKMTDADCGVPYNGTKIIILWVLKLRF